MTVGFSIPNNWPRNIVMNNGLPNGNHANHVAAHHQNHHGYHHSSGGAANHAENYAQPLYVNAPPKPRRIGEPSECAYDKAQPAIKISAAAGGADGSCPPARPPARHQPPNRGTRVECPPLAAYAERRTPDAYGTSPCFDGRPCSPAKASNQLLVSDYEELYNLASAYDHYDSSATSCRSAANPYGPQKPSALVGRPRSVDFLQAPRENGAIASRLAPEQARPSAPAFGVPKGGRPAYMPPPRPKSSIEVVNADGYHWSEEQYAESMRKSAQFLVAKKTSTALTRCMAENKLLQGGKAHSDGAASTDSEPAAVRKSGPSVAANQARTAAVDMKCNSAYSTANGPAAQNDFARSKSARISREKQYGDGAEKPSDEAGYKRKNSWHSKEHGERSNQQVQQVSNWSRV